MTNSRGHRRGQVPWLFAAGILGIHFTAHSADEVAITLDLGAPLPAGQTSIWTPLIQLAWDQMPGIHGVDRIEFTPHRQAPLSPRARHVGEMLNRFQWDHRKVLPPKTAISVVGGIGPEFAHRVNDLLLLHFGRETPSLAPSSWPEDSRGIAIFCHLANRLAFASSFEERTGTPLPFYSGSGVAKKTLAFGSWGKHRPKFVGAADILDWGDSGQRFAVAVSNGTDREGVILVRNPNLKSLDDCIAAVRDMLDSQRNPASIPTPRRLVATDTLLIPKLEISSTENFEDLTSPSYEIDGRRWQIKRAVQRVELSLDEKGADLEVKAFLVPANFLSSGNAGSRKSLARPRERHFVFDRPFYLLIWRKDADLPYFAAHVDFGGLVTVPE